MTGLRTGNRLTPSGMAGDGPRVSVSSALRIATAAAPPGLRGGLYVGLAAQQDITEPEPIAGSLKTNFSWTLAGNLVYATCQWGVLVVIAKLGSTAMVGQFGLALAVTAPIILLANMQLSGVQVTDSRRTYRFQDYLALRIVSTIIAVLGITVAAIPMTSSRELAVIVGLVALTKAADAISDIYFGALRQREQMRRVGIGLIINGALTVVGVWFAMWATSSLIWACVASMVASTVTLLAYNARGVPQDVNLDRDARQFDFAALTRLTRVAMPLGLVGVCVSIYGNMPRYFVEHYYGEHALGLFVAVAYAMTVGTTVVNALGQSAVPRLAKYWATGNARMFWRLLKYLVCFGAAVGAAGIGVALLAGGALLSRFYNPEYGGQEKLLVWIMASASIGYMGSFMGYAINATREFDRLAAPYCGVAVVSVLACWLLVPRFGLVGAAWASGVISLTAALVPTLTFVSLRRSRA